MEQRKPGDFVAEVLPPGVPVAPTRQFIYVKPTKLWILPEGDINDEPVLAFIADTGQNGDVVMQISLAMFNDGLPEGAKLSLNLDPEMGALPKGESNEVVNNDGLSVL